MKEQTRGGDLAARLGGDEFALFLCGIGREAAERKRELLLTAADRLRGFSGDADHPLGIPLALATYEPRTGESLASLFRSAHQALYNAQPSAMPSHPLAATSHRPGRPG